MTPQNAVVNLAVLASEGTGSRAYLEAFQKAALQPIKIIELRLIPRYKITRWTTRLFGKRITWAVIQFVRRWQAARPHMRSLAKAIRQIFPGAPEFHQPINFNHFSPDVERVYAFGLDDPVLVDFLAQQPHKAWLYSTSGIMPDQLLNLPEKYFIHIHPGIVPHVRGGDCLLWSQAVRGQPGMSCFYMDAGIDTGRIIATHEFPPTRLKIDPEGYEESQIYDGLLAFYDVFLRAELLGQLLKVHGPSADYASLPTKEQDPALGRSYFTMHPRVRERVVRELFLTK